MLKCIHVRKKIHFIWVLRSPIILILTCFITFVHYFIYINPSEYFVQLNVVPTVLVLCNCPLCEISILQSYVTILGSTAVM